MKRLLLFLFIIIGASNLQAQECIGIIDHNTNLICDTSRVIQESNSTFWLAKDSSWFYLIGDNNIVYADYPYSRVTIEGSNNKVYFKGPGARVSMYVGSSNQIYIERGNVYLGGDSNIVYGRNISLYVIGYNCIINTDTLNLYQDNGIGSIFNNSNPCPNIAFNYTQAPTNTCNQTTDIIEDHINIDVYPNPATDNVTFNLQNAGEIKTITIYDIAGKIVEVIANINTNKATIDTSKLSTGIYVYSITLANGKTQRGKLLVG